MNMRYAAKADTAAFCMGVAVPVSPYLHPERIRRIEAARYEGQEIRGALHVVGPDDRVLELGAGLGIVGGVVATHATPSRMVSYEANPALIPHIRRLYEMNRLEERIELRNEVLLSAPERPATMPFHIHKSFLGSSLHDQGARTRETVDVPTADYGALRESLNPTVILMDIEGGEAGFLEHADLSGVRAMVIEFHPGVYGVPGMRRCKRILRAAGFAPNADLSSRMVWVAERATD